MLGVYDFCGHYEWTFEWLRREEGHDLVEAYWLEAIHEDAQRHAKELIVPGGLEGMERYWNPTMAHEGGDCVMTRMDDVFRIEMHQCPSKGFLSRNGLEQYEDYCNHCLGWIGPLMRDAGFCIEHEHNHRGQCWWEFRRELAPEISGTPGRVSGARDVRFYETWPGAASLHHGSQALEGPVGPACLKIVDASGGQDTAKTDHE